jgi:hypothetical protein
MAELALNRLTQDGVVSPDEERTASMVSNLMVVLCGEQPPRRSSTPARCIRCSRIRRDNMLAMAEEA